MLHILVLLLNNLITWEHDEVLLVNDGVEKFDHGASVVQVGSIELGREILLDFEKLHLGVVDALNVGFGSLLLLLIELLSSVFIGRILKVWPEQS